MQVATHYTKHTNVKLVAYLKQTSPDGAPLHDDQLFKISARDKLYSILNRQSAV